MGDQTGTGSRGRRKVAVLAAFLLLMVAVIGAGLWAGGVGPFRKRVPGTIYIVIVDPNQPGKSATPLPSASLDGWVEPSATTSATATGTLSAATPVSTVAHPVATTLKPNLVHVAHTPLNMVCEVPFTIAVTIRNAGPVAAGPANVFISDGWTDSAYHPVAHNYTSYPGLDAGETVTVGVALTVGEACDRVHDMMIRLDAAEHVDESNEEDNYLRFTHTLRAPNLYPTDLTIPTNPPCSGVNVGVRINNNGPVGTLRDALVKFTDTVGGHPSFSRSVYVSFPRVAAGTSRIVNVTFPPLTSYCDYLHTMTATVDSSGVIGESSETDNSMARQFTPRS